MAGRGDHHQWLTATIGCRFRCFWLGGCRFRCFWFGRGLIIAGRQDYHEYQTNYTPHVPSILAAHTSFAF
jgi:hypothetical protein